MTSTYLVTAANRGIGLEFAKQLTAAGQRVIATVRSGADAAELRALDVRVEELDVANSASVRALHSKLGEEPIDVLINNAGIYPVKGASFEELEIDEMIETLQVNSLGAMRVTQALLPNLERGSEKKIVHVTSKMGSVEDNSSGGSYAYRMSKSALNMFNKSLSIDLEPRGFACVVVHPGWVQTRMGGSGAPTTVEESVSGLMRVIDGMSHESNGAFFDYQGTRLPW